MLGGMALLGPDADVAATALQGEPPDPSVYIPKAHLVQDRSFLHAFMDEFSFVDLVSTTPTLRITHIPSVLDRAAGRYGTIVGHISAANEQVQAIRAGARAVVVFRGPHGYVSPGWLTTPAARNGVPTWNFAVVHATGRLKVHIDPAARTKSKRAKLKVVKSEKANDASKGGQAAVPAKTVAKPAEPARFGASPAAGAVKPGASISKGNLSSQDDDQDDEDDDEYGSGISKSERRRLKKLARREQRRAA
jgi:predicted FMN-binding regulatory protein PaiB